MFRNDRKSFFLFQDFISNFDKSKIEKSDLVTFEDFIVISSGISNQLNKSIKEIKLLYRTSIDGDLGKKFHSKCDGVKNTVTFIKTINGKRFGGFAHKEWNSNGGWITDKNAFVFSLDFNECYYYNNNGYNIYGNSSYGPCWGYNGNYNYYDILLSNRCLSNTSSMTYQNSFNYNGRSNALSGTNNFQVKDYEFYELILE